MSFFSKVGVKELEWPAQSPELNPTITQHQFPYLITAEKKDLFIAVKVALNNDLHI